MYLKLGVGLMGSSNNLFENYYPVTGEFNFYQNFDGGSEANCPGEQGIDIFENKIDLEYKLDRKCLRDLDFYEVNICLLYTSPSPRDLSTSRMPSSA